MPYYMHQWHYKEEQVRRMMLEDTDRSEIVRIAIKGFGGELIAFFYSFGPYDGVAISSFPNSETALAAVLAISGQGRISTVHTTVLVEPEEGLRAMKHARETIGIGGGDG
jgi:uncharacterized protein with GYD domain